jgi:hypothetical protein
MSRFLYYLKTNKSEKKTKTNYWFVLLMAALAAFVAIRCLMNLGTCFFLSVTGRRVRCLASLLGPALLYYQMHPAIFIN